jgi:hypothetical protein
VTSRAAPVDEQRMQHADLLAYLNAALGMWLVWVGAAFVVV